MGDGVLKIQAESMQFQLLDQGGFRGMRGVEGCVGLFDIRKREFQNEGLT